VLVLVQAGLGAAASVVQPIQSAADRSQPESSSQIRTQHRKESEEGSSAADVGHVDWRSIWEIMLAQFLLGSAMLIYRVDFAVTVSDRYGTSNTANGYISAFSSIVGTVTGFAVGHISDFYAGDARRMFLHSAAAQSLCLLAAANAPRLALFAAGHTTLALATTVGRVASIQATLVRSSQEHTGALIGTGATVLSVARMLAPTASGISQEVFSHYGPGILSCVLSLAGTVVLLIMPSKTPIKTHTQ